MTLFIESNDIAYARFIADSEANFPFVCVAKANVFKKIKDIITNSIISIQFKTHLLILPPIYFYLIHKLSI